MNLITFLSNVSLFKNLTDKQLTIILGKIQPRAFKKGKMLFFENEAVHNLYIIRTGQLKIYKESKNGKTHILHIFGPGEIVAEVPIFEGGHYPANCQATQDTEILLLSRESLLELIKNHPDLALNMLALMAKRIRGFTSTIENLTLKETADRLLTYLKTKSAEKNGATAIELDITKSELAELLGTSRENLSRTMTQMDKDEIIKVNNKKIILL